MGCSKGCSDFIDTLQKCNKPFDLVPKVKAMPIPPAQWVAKGKSEGHGIEARFFAHVDSHMHATLDIIKKCGPPADRKKAQKALTLLSTPASSFAHCKGDKPNLVASQGFTKDLTCDVLAKRGTCSLAKMMLVQGTIDGQKFKASDQKDARDFLNACCKTCSGSGDGQ
jgi:hypothetical protein